MPGYGLRVCYDNQIYQLEQDSILYNTGRGKMETDTICMRRIESLGLH